MSSILRKFSFGIERVKQEGNQIQQNNGEIIQDNNVEIIENFEFYDYSSNSTIKYLKEYFLTTFGQKYKYCKCILDVYYLNKRVYQILSKDESKKLSDFNNIKQFYLIKTNSLCDCELKMYYEYINESKFDILSQFSKSKEEIENLQKLNKDIKSEKEKSNLKNEELINEIKQLKQELEKLKKTDENDINPIFEDFYDIVININSIKNVNKEGWKVKFNKNGLEKYNDHKNKGLITVGVIGNNNKGKSFLLSKISKIKLLTGTSINTEGLSVRYPELKGHKGRHLILLDSAGLETPVLKSDNNEKEKINENSDQNEIKLKKEKQYDNSHNENIKDKEGNLIHEESKKKNDEEKKQIIDFKENATDKIMTELFLENFIINVSDILLIVVGKLTYSEQLLINKIKEESKKFNKGRIFIIHNLQEFRTIKQVQNYIQKYLLKCSTFNLNKRTWITTEEDKEDEQENEKIKENKENLEENKENKLPEKDVEDESLLCKIHFTEILNFDVDKKLEVYHLIMANEDSEAGNEYNPYAYKFIESVYNLISEPKKFDVFEQVKENFIKLSTLILNNKIENASFTTHDEILDKRIMQLKIDKDLSLKKCYTDELGFSFFKTGNFEPKYNYFKPDDNTLEIRLEVPGNTDCSVEYKVEGDKTIITVKGNKRKDKQPENLDKNLFYSREFGEFEVNIPLKVEDFQIKNTEPKEGYPKKDKGICFIQYELSTKGIKKETVKEEDI